MADTKPSAFTADSTPDDADIIPYVDLDGGGAGVHLNKKITFNELTAYLEQRGRQHNASVAQQAYSGNSDTYLVGSDVTIPTSRLQAKAKYRLRFDLAKTSTAGTAGIVVNVRIGTAGTTADTSRGTLTFASQTAVADEGQVDLTVVFRTIGAGTSAVIRSTALLDHRLAVTGLCNVNSSVQSATSAGFDSTVAGLKIGVSMNVGASSVVNVNLVDAVLENLA